LKFSKENPNIKGIRFMRKSQVLHAGLVKAQGVIITMDADLQTAQKNSDHII
jgi:hypothetical protein